MLTPLRFALLLTCAPSLTLTAPANLSLVPIFEALLIIDYNRPVCPPGCLEWYDGIRRKPCKDQRASLMAFPMSDGDLFYLDSLPPLHDTLEGAAMQGSSQIPLNSSNTFKPSRRRLPFSIIYPPECTAWASKFCPEECLLWTDGCHHDLDCVRGRARHPEQRSPGREPRGGCTHARFHCTHSYTQPDRTYSCQRGCFRQLLDNCWVCVCSTTGVNICWQPPGVTPLTCPLRSLVPPHGCLDNQYSQWLVADYLSRTS
eukprot:Blabericola_migrator_1__639@NODE_1159_length_5253_cov_60_233899_g789_i0_p2_GENE_NODE_1159_length_5253_cov_60_233899_g789_i0NODE_1159_length_5253_cov_60_233899_g789_i0_p2_ORF_typecomplete_len258_score2_90_NODE_1159_length_5253_cov_60_233899_g789_i010471820